VSDERRGLLAVAGAALLWSTGGVGIKAVDAPPLAIAGWRSAFAAVVLLAWFRPLPRASGIFLASIGCYAGCLTTFVVATKWTTAANAIFLQYTGVVWVLLLSPLVTGEPRRARDATAIGVALAGMALFFAGRLSAPGRAGDLVALVSGMAFAGVMLLLRRERGRGAEAAVAWGNVLAAAVLTPYALATPVGAQALGLIAVLGTVQLAAAYVLFVQGIRHVEAARAALVGMLEPVANPVWVFLLIGERPSAGALVGGAVVLAAIAWHAASARPTTVPAVPPPD
jgi:drug/metabolite transporter (DMT)-like permease